MEGGPRNSPQPCYSTDSGDMKYVSGLSNLWIKGDPRNSPQPCYPIDSGDMKSVSGLSTLLVATIEEAKDRISQIEYIFCSQLFPTFQSKSKKLQKIYYETRKVAEDGWKAKENDLLLQIEKLQVENKLILEENESLKFEKTKFVNLDDHLPNKNNEFLEELKKKTQEAGQGNEIPLNLLKPSKTKASGMVNSEKILKDLEDKNKLLLNQQKLLEIEAQGYQEELLKKTKEVDEGMELQNKLVQMLQSKIALTMQKEKQLKDQEEEMKKQEEKINELLARAESLEKDYNMIQKHLSAKTDEIEKQKMLQESSLEEIKSLLSRNANYEQIQENTETENRLLKGKVQSLESSVDGLENELRKKIEEVEDGRKLQEQLLQQTDLKSSEIFTTRQQLEEMEKENKLLLSKLKDLEEKVDKLQFDLIERSNEASEEIELQGKLLLQIEAKDTELLTEKKKRREVITAYKNLKSQYNYLCTKFGLTSESMLPQNTIEDGSISSRHKQNPFTSPDNIKIAPKTVACKITEEKEDLLHNRADGLIQRSISISPSTFSSPCAPNCHNGVKSAPISGTKRSSSWRDTRSNQQRSGLDPHDDFLDTPLENIRGSTKKPVKEEVHDLPGPAPMDMNFDISDDETQDMNVDPRPNKLQMVVPKPVSKDFKYVEPVRKKSERENLKGIECKQCKKFYDAVLPDGGGKEADSNKQQLRCEHHEGVSRHRYRYAPPLTPEGFWNIGFESEM